MSADDSFLFGFGQDIHRAFVTVGPVAFGDAVHQADVEVVGAEFAAEAVEIGVHGGGVARPGFGEDSDFVARHMLQCLGHVRMASIGVRSVEEVKPVVIPIEQQIGESLDAERGLMGVSSRADGAGAHGEAASFDSGAAEGDGVGGREFRRESLGCDGVEDGSGTEPGRPEA